MLRTIHVTNAYHDTSGGVRTFYHAVLEAAEQDGRWMRLVVPGERDGVEPLGRDTAIVRIAAARSPVFDRRYRLIRPDHYVGRSSILGRMIAGERPDVLEVSDKYTLCLLAHLTRAGWYSSGDRPTVVGMSSERMDDNVRAFVARGRAAERAAHAYMRKVYAPAFDAHLANSSYTADELTRHAGVREVDVCAMGVDADLFAAAAPNPGLRAVLLAAAGGAVSSVLLLYAGRVSPEKQLFRLVDAVACLVARPGAPDVRLVVAGDGPETSALVARAEARIPGRLRLLGNVPDRRRLASLVASADVFVHPNDREPFGIGPLEAMATGVPVVVPRAGGVLSYAHAGNAWLASPTPDGFADAIAQAITGRDDVRVVRARETARAHAWPVVARRYLEALDRAHARRVSRPAVAPGAVAAARGV